MTVALMIVTVRYSASCPCCGEDDALFGVVLLMPLSVPVFEKRRGELTESNPPAPLFMEETILGLRRTFVGAQTR